MSATTVIAAKAAAKKTGVFLGKNKTTILITIGVLVIILIVWKTIKYVKKIISDKIAKSESEDYTGEQVSVSMQHGALAVRILYACKGPGTDEDEIYAVLGELRTSADWEYLQRKWRSAVMNLSKFQRTLAYSIYGIHADLISTLKSELTKKELDKCRGILKAKGINPGF